MKQKFRLDKRSKINKFVRTKVSKQLLIANLILAIIYFVAITFFFQRGNIILFSLLIAGEVFHLWQIITYIFTIWETEYKPAFDDSFLPAVDVLITVAGEPVDIVKQTVIAAKEMDYPNFRIFILNDGYVAQKDNWEEIEKLAEILKVHCITRKTPGGAKAGNINNGLKYADNPFFAVFDADHVPHKDFLRKTIKYFIDDKVGFVQSPQYYKNYAENDVTEGAWEQQSLFFGPILKGKNRLNSTFMCGTNMVIRREALFYVGGMCETNIAEDFLTSLFIHEKGWKSVYVPEVLARGLAPEDFLSYYKQQFRWARGSLEVIFKYNPIFRKNLTWKQRIQYLASSSYYLSGIIVLIDALLPIVFFFTQSVPLQTATMDLAAIFIPYILLNIYILQMSCNYTFSFRAISFSLSSFTLQIKAIFAVLTNQKTKFSVTPKQQQHGNFTYLVIPHLIYVFLAITGATIAIIREGINASVATNIAWASLNIAVFTPFILAAVNYKERHKLKVAEKIKQKRHQNVEVYNNLSINEHGE